MGLEIERKYLVAGEYKKYSERSYPVIQAYLCAEKDKVVRIRISDNKAWLTIKGAQVGISRYEWEKSIPVSEARELIKLCSGSIIEKTRYLIPLGEFTIEVDEFAGRNRGLVIAEIELKSENDKPDLPDWLGKDVSDDFRYHNSYLSTNPFSDWL